MSSASIDFRILIAISLAFFFLFLAGAADPAIATLIGSPTGQNGESVVGEFRRDCVLVFIACAALSAAALAQGLNVIRAFLIGIVVAEHDEEEDFANLDASFSRDMR